MTEIQKLLAQYAANGSEDAFRELVGRYLSLVYSTALRLVDGDMHRAQDVAQEVFMDLARLACGLSSNVMPGAGCTVTPALSPPRPCAASAAVKTVKGRRPK